MEQFEVELEEVEIEIYATRGEAVPRAKRYGIRIDDFKFTVEKHDLTEEELLKLAGKCDCSHSILQLFHHADAEPIKPGEKVDLHRHGIERFATVHKEEVTIFVNYDEKDKPIQVKRGEVEVNEIKRLAGVPDSYTLYSATTGLPLDDTASVPIAGCEEFSTQVKGGTTS